MEAKKEYRIDKEKNNKIYQYELKVAKSTYRF